MIRESLLVSLITLLDDSDQSVRVAAWNKLQELGEFAIEEIEQLLPDLGQKYQNGYLESLLNELKIEIVLKRLKSYLDNPDPLLLDGLLLVSNALEPDLDKIKYLSIVQDIADEILLEISDNRTAIENMEIFNYIFFRRIGFQHEDDTVTVKENALITKVLESKKGNIFTIPMCYFILARQSGLPVYPVIAGKSFTPAYLNSEDMPVFYINIYKNGIIFSKDLTERERPTRVGVDKALVSIYADHLNYLFKSVNDKESSSIMERVLECFGNLRYIN
ncbi:MAG: transglutaminase family protein [Bacteroidales bacterium]